MPNGVFEIPKKRSIDISAPKLPIHDTVLQQCIINNKLVLQLGNYNTIYHITITI